MNRDCIVKEALFTDGTEQFVVPSVFCTGDRVRIRFRTLKDNVDRVELIFSDGSRTGMYKAWSDALFDFYEAEVTAGPEMYYRFEVFRGEESYLFHRELTLTADFEVPEWMQGAVVYQIFPDRFRNGCPDNDVREGEFTDGKLFSEHIDEGEEDVKEPDILRFYGGDLQGIAEKLPYLKDLGVEALYLNPVFVSPSNHKYDCQDYEHIDPHLAVIRKEGGYRIRTTDPENLEASNAYFESFVKSCHEAGIRVILDGVFNHCGSCSNMFNAMGFYEEPGAYESKDSRWAGFFHFENEDPAAWPCNDSYDKWWGMTTLPKLDYENNGELEAYMLSIAEKWIAAPYDADGWRLDVAEDLGPDGDYNHHFWQMFRKAVKSVKKDAVILAEHYGDPGPWLQGNEWDTIMNYRGFMDPVSYFVSGMEKHSDYSTPELKGNGAAFFEAMRAGFQGMPWPSVLSSLNQLDNHDHSRMLTRTSGRCGRLRTAGAAAAEEGVSVGLFMTSVVIQMCWPGAPGIYYGDEAGLCGWTDPDSRRPFPWGKENLQLTAFYKALIRVRNRPVFRKGSLIALYGGEGVIAFGRMLGQEAAVVIVNVSDGEKEVRIPVWQCGIAPGEQLLRVFHTQGERFEEDMERPDTDMELSVRLAPCSASIYLKRAD